jgi:hypothetical protein
MIRSERIEKFKTLTKAAITRTVTGLENAEPTIYEHEDGSTTEIHPRFSVTEESAWIQLWDGRLTEAKPSDIVIQTDKAGTVFECIRMSEVPKDTVVFDVGLTLPPNILTRTNEKGEVFRSYQFVQNALSF